MRSFSAQNIYVEEFADPTVAYVAKRMAEKYQYPAPAIPSTSTARGIQDFPKRALMTILLVS